MSKAKGKARGSEDVFGGCWGRTERNNRIPRLVGRKGCWICHEFIRTRLLRNQIVNTITWARIFEKEDHRVFAILNSIYSFIEYRNNGYLIIRDIILDMLLINSLWLVTMIKSVISNNIILFLKKKNKGKLIFHWLYRFIYLVVVCYVNVFFSFLSFLMILRASPHLVWSPVLTAGIQLNLKLLKQRNLIYKKSQAVACLRLRLDL